MNNNEELKKIIVEATTEVFEQMAFVDVEEDDFEEEAGSEPEKQNEDSCVQIMSTLGFSGRYSGTVSVAYSQKLAKILAANILGVDVEEVKIPEDVIDSVREVTNMIGGSVLTRLTEEGEPVDLTVPKVGMVDSESDFIEDESAIVIRFDAEGERVVSKMKCRTEDMTEEWQ